MNTIITLLASCFFVLLPVFTFAAEISLPRTGQTTCYDTAGNVIDCAGTGQDGDIPAGVALPEPRFLTQLSDGSIVNPSTDTNLATNISVTAEFTVNSYYTPFKLPDSGLTTCYNEIGTVIVCPEPNQPLAQDGSYNINPLSYKDNNNGTVTDNNTGLMWQKQISGTRYNWYEASGTFDTTHNPTSKNTCGSVKLGGYSDWRLPSKLELMSLVDYGIPDPGPKIDPDYFPNSQPWDYTTATTFAGNSDEVWNVSFRSGGVGLVEKSGDCFIRCVRGAQLDFGNFIDNHNGTVTNIKNGLMWQQDEPGTKTWSNAISYCESLSLGGHLDWRLPNFKELQSLTDEYSAYPAINTTYFPNAHVDESNVNTYWSSTTYDYSRDGVYAAHFYEGGYLGIGKTGGIYTRCVRNGQTSDIVILTYTSGTGGTISGVATQAVNRNATGTAVQAIPNAGYHFMKWSDGSTSNPRIDTNVTADISVTAEFAINSYHTVTFDPGAYGSWSSGGELVQEVFYGSSAVEPVIKVKEGWIFTGWSKDFSNVTEDMTVVAQYKQGITPSKTKPWLILLLEDKK